MKWTHTQPWTQKELMLIHHLQWLHILETNEIQSYNKIYLNIHFLIDYSSEHSIRLYIWNWWTRITLSNVLFISPWKFVWISRFTLSPLSWFLTADTTTYFYICDYNYDPLYKCLSKWEACYPDHFVWLFQLLFTLNWEMMTVSVYIW